MQRRIVSKGLLLTAATSGLFPLATQADDLKDRLRHYLDHEKNQTANVTVAFGAGLNTAQPGNPANHHILPREIALRSGGVVTFMAAGFHQIIVFGQGVVHGQIALPPTGVFIFDPAPPSLLPVHYQGLRPAGGPPPGLAPTSDPSNAQNRIESVSF
ncbi:MAG: hypothetical protein JWR74_1555, partial [Polaromonas sp.]|nr:hypothetical protein [Polaromonas sp.]